MVWCIWGSKGGSGCSVVAAAAAILSAKSGPVLLVDLAGGDLATILGVEPSGLGLASWLRHPNPPPDSLARLEVGVVKGLNLLPLVGRGATASTMVRPGSSPSGLAEYGSTPVGRDPVGPGDPGERLSLLAHVLAADDRTVIVDLGVQRLAGPAAVAVHAPSAPPMALAVFVTLAVRSTLVTRLCYPGLAAAMDLPVPDDVIVVAEPDRALRIADVASALRSPVSTVRWDPAVARAVDAGLLVRRLPRALQRIQLQTPRRAAEGTPARAGDSGR